MKNEITAWGILGLHKDQRLTGFLSRFLEMGRNLEWLPHSCKKNVFSKHTDESARTENVSAAWGLKTENNQPNNSYYQSINKPFIIYQSWVGFICHLPFFLFKNNISEDLELTQCTSWKPKINPIGLSVSCSSHSTQSNLCDFKLVKFNNEELSNIKIAEPPISLMILSFTASKND